ncbi:hypothetical protein AAMO2058_000100800 [Amorphochlora amoebiformis]
MDTEGSEDPFTGAIVEDAPVEDEAGGDPFDGGMGGEDSKGLEEDPNAVFSGVPAETEEPEDVFAGALDEKEGGGGMSMLVAPADGPYAKWQEEHRKKLEKRRQEAREKKEKILEDAETSMKKFYDDRSSSKDKDHKQNLDDEKQKRADYAKLFKEGENDWEKVCKVLTLAPDSNRKVDRFRKLLMKLKNEGTYSKSKKEVKA